MYMHIWLSLSFILQLYSQAQTEYVVDTTLKFRTSYIHFSLTDGLFHLFVRSLATLLLARAVGGVLEAVLTLTVNLF
jgi:hypothetical protein